MKNINVRISSHMETSLSRSMTTRLFLAAALMLSVFVLAQAQEQKTIKLNSPNKDAGFSIMKSLSLRQTTRDTSKWSDKDLSLQDLSNLMWAGAGVNREDGRRTAASAMNSQDVTIYAIMKDGTYAYDSANHVLNLVASGDHRSEIGMGRGGPAPAGAPGGAPGGAAGGAAGAPPGAAGGAPGGTPAAMPAGTPGGAGAAGQSFSYPLKIVLVSDLGKFRAGTAELKSDWGAFDAGLVAENMMLYCSGMDLASHAKAAADSDGKIKNLLKLTDTQHPVIELDIGYIKQ
jgi:hypothetical protein